MTKVWDDDWDPNDNSNTMFPWPDAEDLLSYETIIKMEPCEICGTWIAETLLVRVAGAMAHVCIECEPMVDAVGDVVNEGREGKRR